MSEDGLQVDLDDLSWEAGKRYTEFLNQDPEKLRWAAEVVKEHGMIDDEESKKMLADADFIEEEQKRLQERFQGS